MHHLLTKHNIPSANITAASDFLNAAPDATVAAFINDLGLNLTGNDALTASRFAADAILRGAGAVDKVVGYVAKRMTGAASKPATTAVSVTTIVGAPVVDTPDVTIVPVIEAGPAIAVKVKGKRGRPRNGDSDFCRAVAAIEKVGPAAERDKLLAAVTAQKSSKGGKIKHSSAVVYLWRYGKGERE